MPTITLNRKVLLKQVGKRLSDEQLKHDISYLGTDLEDVDDEITVEVFPNRPDMLSEQGFARALSTFCGASKGLKKYKVEESGEEVKIHRSVNDVRPYTACAIVKGLKLNEDKIAELMNIQEKLHVTYGRRRRKVAIGMYPMEKIEMPIHYKAYKPKKIKFHPLESNREMTAQEILEEHPKGKKFAHLLEGCKKYPVFEDNNGKILSMPPIINSHDVGRVGKKTKDVFIECSGHDFEVLKKALNIMVTVLADMGGKIYSMKLGRQTTPDLSPEKLGVNIGYVNERLGLELNEKQFKQLVEKMGYGYDGKVLVPAYRTDVLHPIDIVEDVAIAYGYDNFTEEIPDVSTIGNEAYAEKFAGKVREILMGHGLIETKTYVLSNKKMQCDWMNLDLDVVELSNSLSEEYNVLRTWITPNLLKVLSENKHNEYPQDIFEIGRIVKGDEEPVRAAVALCGENSDYTKAKQILDSLLEAVGIQASYYEDGHPSFINGRAARVKVEGKGIAYVGEVSPEVLENFNLDMPVTVFELNLTDLLEFISS